jgi:hypothetical protein
MIALAKINSLEKWESKRGEYRRQLLEMLGLDPLPEKTPLEATVTGKVEHEEFTVENLHYQSRPGLYVTGNLYVPKNLDKPAPAVLYVCGHGPVKKDGVSYGNKVSYQHHGAWFARNGYVCLTIDTLQMGEIEGIHHGTHRYNMWWWFNRGYTPLHARGRGSGELRAGARLPAVAAGGGRRADLSPLVRDGRLRAHSQHSHAERHQHDRRRKTVKSAPEAPHGGRASAGSLVQDRKCLPTAPARHRPSCHRRRPSIIIGRKT